MEKWEIGCRRSFVLEVVRGRRPTWRWRHLRWWFEEMCFSLAVIPSRDAITNYLDANLMRGKVSWLLYPLTALRIDCFLDGRGAGKRTKFWKIDLVKMHKNTAWWKNLRIGVNNWYLYSGTLTRRKWRRYGSDKGRKALVYGSLAIIR